MADVTVSQFAEVLKVPVERLLTQLDEAGIRVSGADDTISDDAKMELLTFLRRAHGRTQDSAAPRKITLQRKSQGEIKVASAQGRARMVNVEVRSKKTYLNRSVLEERARVQQEEVDRQKHEVERAKHDGERAKETHEEDLLKQQRMEAEQREAEARQRLELEEEAKRRADEEARVAAEEEARRQAEARERQEA
ncbi:MAG TPA: translation initiation factor IF-2 associated domain-containing protein, partial [Burkholderiales bacterium]|nr:translation initiation factor IF-2 associated domain-containing protein [Burkholderiales bacterium]